MKKDQQTQIQTTCSAFGRKQVYVLTSHQIDSGLYTSNKGKRQRQCLLEISILKSIGLDNLVLSVLVVLA